MAEIVSSVNHHPPGISSARQDLCDMENLPGRIIPRYPRNTYGTEDSESFMTLSWPKPPRNVLLVPKLLTPHVMDDMCEFIKYIWTNYPGLNILLEPPVAQVMHERLPCPVFTGPTSRLPAKVDIVATLGGDGTILRAARLFGMHSQVPPMLSFSMGTLGFLGEWKFDDYKRAWREVYMSGSGVPAEDLQGPHTQAASINRKAFPLYQEFKNIAWPGIRGKSMGSHRGSRMLLRHRIKVEVYNEQGKSINTDLMLEEDLETLRVAHSSTEPFAFHAMNELLIHRGEHPHLAIMDIYINEQFLTEVVADGMLLSTPTGSTAYSLSAGGAIVHPWVKCLLMTPICPRSLSFRPLVLPLNAKVTLKLSKKNRGRNLEVSIDGKRLTGISSGMEIHVAGERLRFSEETGSWSGGVPCVLRGSFAGRSDRGAAEDDDGWVGGLNGLLKFNYPFGEH
ncbi:NADH kinase pos5, mitochondrial [Ceratocystis fimbriata CBS 114723]|uniref:NADH kinase pos5, mitochondrial n=1 Tax=Ceratocystis fimbriata CBS 114723 TaxID=1035309 RepID=A0A2C5WYZ1_9PEZI|nr:NADH kinase pos5, mitochondrial [Ceratocystis fimbriata CBS 114723]